MPAPLTHRTTAVKGARLAQFGFLALCGIAAAVFTIGLPIDAATSQVADPPPVVRTSGGQGEAAKPNTLRPAVYEDIAEGLLSIANAPKPVETGPVNGEGGEVVDGGGEVEAPSTTEVAFIGAVFSGEQRIAVLRIDGVQRWIAEGQERDGVRVQEVTEDRAVISRKGVPSELDKSSPARGSLTRLAAAPTRAGQRPGFPAPAGGTPASRSPMGTANFDAQAEAEKSAAEGISEDGAFVDSPEARMQRMREAAERARERGLRRGGNN